MAKGRDRVVWLGDDEGERTKTAIAALQGAICDVRDVLGPAPLLRAHVADNFNIEHTPRIVRDRIEGWPESVTEPVHMLFRRGRPFMRGEEHYNGGALNRKWLTGHSEIFLRTRHAYDLSTGFPDQQSEAMRVLAHEYGHVRANGLGQSRLDKINEYNPSSLAQRENRIGAISGMHEYFAVRDERMVLHAVNGRAASLDAVATTAKDFAQVVKTGSEMTDISPRRYSEALGYLSGTLNAHLDADMDLRGNAFSKSSQGVLATIAEHIPAGSKERKFLNQTRGSYVAMRRALESGTRLQGTYMDALAAHSDAMQALDAPVLKRVRPAPLRRAVGPLHRERRGIERD